MKSLKESLERYSWRQWLLAINLFFIVATIIARHKYGGLLHQFNLAHELNIATWWSGICLMALGLLSYEHCCSGKDDTGLAWLALTILFLALSWDEIGSIHERVGSFSKLSIFAVAGIIILSYSLYKLFRRKEARRAAVFILWGFVLLGSVAFQEHLEHLIRWPWFLRGIRAGIEEGTELMGMFLCFLGIASLRNREETTNSIKSIVPNPLPMRNLPHLLFIGFVIHVIVSIYVSHHITDSPPRGNPAIWYPAALFFLLFASCFHKSLKEEYRHREKWLLFSICFVIFSVGTILVPMSKLISNFYSFSLFQIPVIVLLYLSTYGKMTRKDIVLITAMAIVLLSGFISVHLGIVEKGISIEYIILGMYAFVISKIILIDHFHEFFQITKSKARSSDAK